MGPGPPPALAGVPQRWWHIRCALGLGIPNLSCIPDLFAADPSLVESV